MLGPMDEMCHEASKLLLSQKPTELHRFSWSKWKGFSWEEISGRKVLHCFCWVWSAWRCCFVTTRSQIPAVASSFYCSHLVELSVKQQNCKKSLKLCAWERKIIWWPKKTNPKLLSNCKPSSCYSNNDTLPDVSKHFNPSILKLRAIGGKAA